MGRRSGVGGVVAVGRGVVLALCVALVLTGCELETGSSPATTADALSTPPAPTPDTSTPTEDPDPPAAVVVEDHADGEREAPSSSPSPSPTAHEPLAPEVVDSEPTTALAALALLEVRPRDPKTGYDRDLFGYRAVDLDRNGCDTRNDILGRDLREAVFKPGTRDFVVLSGVLFDPYTASAVTFDRGDGGNLVQIDHVVALGDAWQKGAQRLDEDTLRALGNDPLNLLAVYARANSQKGDGDAATWLPSNKAFRCAYVARQVAVKHAYGLWVAPAEKDAIERILRACPDEPLPVAATVPDVPQPSETIAPEPPAPTPSPTPTAEPEPDDVYYKNCTAAREAGVTPIYEGQPGYGRHLDRDGDGVACE